MRAARMRRMMNRAGSGIWRAFIAGLQGRRLKVEGEVPGAPTRLTAYFMGGHSGRGFTRRPIGTRPFARRTGRFHPSEGAAFLQAPTATIRAHGPRHEELFRGSLREAEGRAARGVRGPSRGPHPASARADARESES